MSFGNKLLKTILVLSLTTMMTPTALTFTGCGSPDKDPSTTPAGNEAQYQEFKDRYSSLISTVKTDKNFTADVDDVVYAFEKDGMLLDGAYYVVSDDKDIKISKNADQKWQKDFTTVSFAEKRDQIVDEIDDVTWEKLEDGKLKGTQDDGDAIEATIKSGYTTVKINGAKEVEISKVGITDFTIPTVEVDNTIQEEVVDTQEIIAQMESFISNTMKYDNFTYKVSNATAKFKNSVMYLSENGKESYYTKENAKNYVYTMESDGKWHKRYTDKDSYATIDELEASFQSIVWGEYDKETNSMSATMGQHEVSISLDGNKMTITKTSPLIVQELINDRPVVARPTENIIDETTIVEEKIFTKKNGKFTVNAPLFVETVEEFFKEQNFYNKMQLSSGWTFEKIVSVNVNDSTFKFAALVKNPSGQEYYSPIKATDKFLTEMLSTDHTKDTLKEYLVSKVDSMTYPFQPDSAAIKSEYNTLTSSNAEKQEFNTLTENIFNKIATKGYQGSSINNAGTPVPEYENANVLFGFKGYNSDTHAAADLGNIESWFMYYIVEVDGQMKFVKVGVTSREDGVGGDSIDKVLSDLDNVWMVNTIEEININNENANLYTSSKIAEKSKE